MYARKLSLRKLIVAMLVVTTFGCLQLMTNAQSMWVHNGTGWWYQNADGSYPASAWQQIDDQYYYFNGSGYMVSNCWIGNYYLGANGAMLKNTTTPDDYQVDENGKWIPAETHYGGGATWGSSSDSKAHVSSGSSSDSKAHVSSGSSSDSKAHVSSGSGAGAFNPSDPAYLHADGKIIGNVKSHIYHWPGSRSYKRVSMANAEFFDSAADAEAAGYRAARR